MSIDKNNYVKAQRELKTDDGYKIVSQETLAESVLMADGTTVENDITNINTALSNKAEKATTLSGYGITDAASSLQGEKADTAVQSVKLGDKECKNGTSVFLPEYPTTLPASDVKAWAKANEKPTYTASEVGADPSGSADEALASAKTYADGLQKTIFSNTEPTLNTNDEWIQLY